MALTLAQKAARVKRQVVTARLRKSALRRVPISQARFARVAAVSDSMAWKWANGRRESAKCDRTLAMLSGKGRNGARG
jgi:hypothetical protein